MAPSHSRLAAALAGAAILLVSGCQRNEDPAHAGFFSGVANLAGGTYERRAAEQQEQLSESERLRQQMAVRATASAAERERTGAELRDKQARMAALDSELARLERAMRSARQQRQGTEAELKAAETKLAELKARRAQIAQRGDNPDAGTEAELERQKTEVSAMLDALAPTTRRE